MPCTHAPAVVPAAPQSAFEAGSPDARRTGRRRPTAPLLGAMLLSGIAVLSLCGCAGVRPVDQVKASGSDAYDRGEFVLAREEFGEAVDRYPGDWEAQYRYGMTCLELGAWDSARTALKVANDRRPQSDDVADAYARSMFHVGDREALVAFLWGRTAEIGSTRDWVRAAVWLDRIGDRDAALAAIETAIEVDDGQSPQPYVVAAEMAERNGDRDLAVRRLRQAYGVRPGDAEVTAALEDLGEIPGPTFALPPGR